METALALILGLLIVLFLYSFLLIMLKVRSYALLLVALLPPLFFTLDKVLVESKLDLGILTTGTVLGLLLAAIIGYLLRNKIE